jgi:hypothetical protein
MGEGELKEFSFLKLENRMLREELVWTEHNCTLALITIMA